MRIFVQSRHQYPAKLGGPGGGRVFDLLVKGLAELGHEVLYYLELGSAVLDKNSLPDNVTLVDRLGFDADVYHLRSDSGLCKEMENMNLPRNLITHEIYRPGTHFRNNRRRQVAPFYLRNNCL